MRHRITVLIVVSTIAIGALVPSAGADFQAGGVNPPLTYFHTTTGVIVYVETDRRHVSAIDTNGIVLWTRNQVEEGSLPLYSAGWPAGYITTIGPDRTGRGDELARGMNQAEEEGSYAVIGFSSRQFGFLNIMTGDFLFGGQD